ncbi:MAG: hypothetical protein WBB67_12075 [bacterium]
MKSPLLLYNPTLDSVLMVEELIRKQSGKLGKYQLWKRLPRKMMYQTYQVIISYLEDSNKILIDKDGKIIWIWAPEIIKKIEKKDLIIK